MARYSTTYSRDPYWTTAKFSSVTEDGQKVNKGDRVFYYPIGKKVLIGEAAEQAALEFYASKQDEDFFNC